jgi:catechol 2,3-dioxygenase-like lactoylglutathione lyase family enzyme
MSVVIDNTRLLVDRFDDCLRFYRDILGLRVVWGKEGSGYASFEDGKGSRLALFLKSQQSEVMGTTKLPKSIEAQDRFMLILGTEDLDDMVRMMRERGAVFLMNPADHPEWGIRTAYLRDPDGNLVEVNSPLPEGEWDKGLREEAEEYRP